MSKEEFSNQTVARAVHIASTHVGELMQQKRTTIRGKGKKETRKESYDAIFTFENPLFCPESDIPLDSGYFRTEEGVVEVTQLIGRFNSESERNAWISRNLEVSGATNT